MSDTEMIAEAAREAELLVPLNDAVEMCWRTPRVVLQ